MSQTGEASKIKLHLGCYNIVLDGWINTDVTVQIYVAKIPFLPKLLYMAGLMSKLNFERHEEGIFRRVKYLNVTKHFPYADNSVDFVYSSHMFEHLCPDEAQICVRELYRVTKPNGIVRLALPDLDRMVAEYDPNNTDEFLYRIYQGRERKTHKLARHWWHYNKISLTKVLKDAGFNEVTRCQYQQGHCEDLEKIEHSPQSLFMEARK